MTLKNLTSFGILTIFILISWTCYPSKEATAVRTEQLAGVKTTITTPTKAVLQDASIVLFPKGFIVVDDTLKGKGDKYVFSGQTQWNREFSIPLVDIAAITKYELRNSPGEVIGSFLHGTIGASMTGLAVYCAVCPKCCFGSCPTVYTFDGRNYNLEAELFSHCISRQLEEDDLDVLTEPVSEDRHFKLRLTNEALETHYINKLSVFAAYHHKGTKVYSSSNGEPTLVNSIVEASDVFDRAGENVTNLVRVADTLAYRSNERAFLGLVSGNPVDWLDVKFQVPPGTKSVKMVIRLKNTLLSTVLLYDLVLGSQGLKALSWTDRMDTDPVYASEFRAVYKSFSGIAVRTFRNGNWVQEQSIQDAGPLAWKTVVAEIPVDKAGVQIVRLQFVPDNVMIDRIAIQARRPVDPTMVIEELKPMEIRDNTSVDRNDVLPLIASTDERYLVTNPGDSYRLIYEVPEKPGFEATIFIRSRGYYTEWLRGRWIREDHSTYQFSLFKPGETFNELAHHWLTDRDEIESLFFDARIPIKEVQ